ncbi:Na+/phosphate symporter [Caulobacter ginsengisoli]|uniref:Na+/phosphate symporter n=1 Tax=Caulobacter ginsengisoli TaxID=400775 RepID=A0ABU0ITL4_9CAUL|nr:hypothetical protein [Caulobacter ginsengisoli]MDQ0465352.1 Na+/phosphate symporter [Caulobacter ginsengisoli]
MPRVSLAFFTTALLCGLTGMVWGSYMGATQNFILAPAHAHLNLLGWVTLSIMGTFYALAGDRASRRLAWANWAVSTLGVIIMTPMLAYLLSGHEKEIGPLMPIPELTVIIGMLLFAVSVLSLWRKPA